MRIDLATIGILAIITMLLGVCSFGLICDWLGVDPEKDNVSALIIGLLNTVTILFAFKTITEMFWI